MVIPNWRNLCLSEDIQKCQEEVLVFTTEGGGTTGFPCLEARDASEHPRVQRIALHGAELARQKSQ